MSRELKNGDAVEIITNPKQRPSRDWLAFVKTSRARQYIRQWLRREEFAAAIRLGKELLDRELKRARRSLPTSAEALKTGAAALGHPDFNHVYEALGRGDIGPTAVIKQFHPDHEPVEEEAREPSPLARLAAKLRISPPEAGESRRAA